MRISFDVDDTLVCYQEGSVYEPDRVPWFLRPWFREPLRSGARDLMRELVRDGHEVWIYTTSLRAPAHMKWWLRCYGIPISGVVNDAIHMKYLKANGYDYGPSKLPSAWHIDLHVDDSEGVLWEGQKHGFAVVVIDPTDAHWTQKIRAAVQNISAE